MDPTKLPPGVLIAGLVAVVVVAVLMRGKSSQTVTTGGPDGQTNFSNAVKLTELDTARRTALTSALLQYDKQRKDYSLGQSTLAAKTQIETQQLNNALSLGNKALDTSYGLGMAQNQTTERIAQGQQAVESQNGVLNFFGGLFGGILKLFTGGL